MIGCGSIGRRHIGHLLALGCEVQAVDVSADAMARAARDYPALDTGDHLLYWPSVDAVVIATPCENHLYWVQRAVELRKPFFVEKPLGTLEQLPRWREIAAFELPINQVGYQLRFHPDVLWLEESIRPIEYLNLTVCWDGRKYADPFLESSHELDLAQYLLGDVRVESYDRAAEGEIVMDLSGGHVVRVNPAADHYLRLWHLQSAVRAASVCFESPEAVGADAYGEELQHFLFCVRTGIPTDVPLAEGLATLELCQQALTLAQAPR